MVILSASQEKGLSSLKSEDIYRIVKCLEVRGIQIEKAFLHLTFLVRKLPFHLVSCLDSCSGDVLFFPFSAVFQSLQQNQQLIYIKAINSTFNGDNFLCLPDWQQSYPITTLEDVKPAIHLGWHVISFPFRKHTVGICEMN